MSDQRATIILNGKMCRIEAGETADSLLEKGGLEGEGLVKVSHAKAEQLAGGDRIEKGGKYRSIPPTTQG